MLILLIDDDKDLLNLTQTVLEKHGYEISAFTTAEEGIAYARSNKPNLILMDLMLPGISGEEAVKLLRSDDNLRTVPVVFLTGLVGAEESGHDQKLKVDGLNYVSLGKPFTIQKLLEIVRKFAV